MKKIPKITAALLLPLLIILNSCFEPIFYEIRKDVIPEEATVSGNIGQITRFNISGKEYLFLAADNGLRYKERENESHDSWKPADDLPFNLVSYDFENTSMSGRQLIGVFANSDTLYIVAASYETTGSEGTTNPIELELWGKTGNEEWKHINKDSAFDYFPIGYDSSIEKYYSKFHLFQTNSPMKAHRNAYICSKTDNGYKYFRLTGTDEPADITDEVIGHIEDGGEKAYSAVYFNGKIRFYSSKNAITDETYQDEARHVYYGQGSDLYCDGKNVCDAGHYISSLAVTSNSILIGRGNITSTTSSTGGLKRVLLKSNGIPEGTTSDFETNADFQITSSYEVLSLLNATPGETENDSILYAAISFSSSSGIFDNIGLWSYYPNRKNWNRE